MAGVRVISRDGSTPSIAALLIRNVFRLIDSLPLFYGIGLIAVIATPEHRRIGDLAAGTVLAYEAPAAAAPAAPELATAAAAYDAVAAELVAELLQRWPLLTTTARRRLALQLLSRQGVPIETLTGADDASLHTHLELRHRKPHERFGPSSGAHRESAESCAAVARRGRARPPPESPPGR
jgi:hypothetical protein